MIKEALASSDLAWEEIHCNRGEYLIEAGQVERHIYFIVSG